MIASPAKIRVFYKTHRRMPSYAEMMKLFGYRSKAAVFYAVRKLIEQGAITRDREGRLAPAKLYGNIGLLGYVEAGFPSPAEADTLDTLSLDEFLIRDEEKTFLLKVKGDSMIDAGIFEGDFVIAERTERAEPGDIVIAELDGEFTMKYYRRKGRQAYLEPANKRYPLLFPERELKVAAIVKGVVRKY